MYSIIFLAITSFALCLLLTPLVRVASKRRGFLDYPGARKLHLSPVPRTGGVAIAGAYVIAVLLLLAVQFDGSDIVNIPLVLQLFPAAALVFMVGLVDDLAGVKPFLKLAVQVVAAVVAYSYGVTVDGVAGYALPDWLSLVLTVVWLVGCSNAFNLIDGMDGLATGVGLFATFTILVAALLHNNVPLALATAPLVGALLAFLRYNFNPASIFLGDSGSLTIGFLLGCFGAIWSQKSATLLGMTAPLMALSIPLLDTGVAIIRRFIRRQPIFGADRNHLHHRLLDRGWSPRRVALIVYGACGLAAAFSLMQASNGHSLNGLLLVLFCVTAWAGIQFVGYAEFDVARSLVMSGTFRDIVHARMFIEGLERRIAVASSCDDYWDAMRDVSRDLGFAHVRMMLGGTTYEESESTRPVPEVGSSTMRIELGDAGYVNFRFAAGASVRHAVAILSVANIVQRSVAAKAPHVLVEAPSTPAQTALPWEPAAPGPA